MELFWFSKRFNMLDILYQASGFHYYLGLCEFAKKSQAQTTRLTKWTCPQSNHMLKTRKVYHQVTTQTNGPHIRHKIVLAKCRVCSRQHNPTSWNIGFAKFQRNCLDSPTPSKPHKIRNKSPPLVAPDSPTCSWITRLFNFWQKGPKRAQGISATYTIIVHRPQLMQVSGKIFGLISLLWGIFHIDSSQVLNFNRFICN